jgi:hypothetical protein
MDEYINQGVSELAVMTAGPDIPGELKAFAQALDVARRPSRTAPENPHPPLPVENRCADTAPVHRKGTKPVARIQPRNTGDGVQPQEWTQAFAGGAGTYRPKPRSRRRRPRRNWPAPQSSRRTDHEQHLSRGRGCGLETRRHR